MADEDVWEAGDAYERYVGRWSRPVAREFLGWLGRPAGLRWLDVGCGTGALCAAIVEGCAPAELVGIDPSAGFIATARGRIAAPGRASSRAAAKRCRWPTVRSMSRSPGWC